MRRVGVAELKDNLSGHLRAVEAGAEVEVTDRDRATARILPAREQREIHIRRSSIPIASIRTRRYQPLSPGIDSLTLLREERGGW